MTDHAFGGRAGVDVAEILRVKDRIDRSWRIPQIVAGRPAGFASELESYLALLRRLYAGIAEVSGCSVVVNSTKDESHGYLLTRLGATIDLRVLHLVRDARAAAYSRARTRHHPGWGRTMQRYGPLRAALEWDAINALTSRLRSRAGRYAVLRYEDFAADPEGAVRWVLRAVLDVGDRDAPWIAPRTIELGIDHTVAGNPVRFHRGPLEVRADEEWRDRMRPAANSLVGTPGGAPPPVVRLLGPPGLRAARMACVVSRTSDANRALVAPGNLSMRLPWGEQLKLVNQGPDCSCLILDPLLVGPRLQER